MGVGDDQADAAEPALDERAHELRPEGLVLGGADVDPEHMPFAVGGDATATTVAIETTRPSRRTLW